MKLKRKRRYVYGNQSPNLIGYAGKATVDRRLFPLRMNSKYRNTLEQAKHERNAKVSQMIKFSQQYEDLNSLMNSLKQENMGKCNTDLLMELNETRGVLKRKLHHLEAELGCIPKDVKGSRTDGILGPNVKVNLQSMSSVTNCAKQRQESWLEKGESNSTPKHVQARDSSYLLEEGRNEEPKTRNRWSGSFKSQIVVRKSNFQSQIQPVNIDLFSCGRDLLQLLTEEFGEDINAYNLMFGTKQVDLDKTLFEQEIYHGTTVELNLRLQGGEENYHSILLSIEQQLANYPLTIIYTPLKWCGYAYKLFLDVRGEESFHPKQHAEPKNCLFAQYRWTASNR